VSGAQWSPERLNELAACQGPEGYPIQREVADALRAFASVVGVLDDARAFVITRDGIDCIAVLERWEPPGDAPHYLAHHRETGDTPLAAILALADVVGGEDA
jgi:hypothetical protein